MKDSEKEFLINEIAKDLYENPDDSLHILNGLKAGYPDSALEIGLAAIERVSDRRLLESHDLQKGLQEMREGKIVEL